MIRGAFAIVGVLFAALLSALFSGCTAPAEVAAHRAAELRWEVADAAIAARDLPEREITWTEAVDVLRAEGPAVLRADDAVRRAEIASTRPYRNLIPQLDVRAGVFEQINQLGGLSSSDIVFDVFITNLLGGLVNIPENIFVAELRLLRSRLQREQAWREQVIVLHTLFLQSAALDERLRVTRLTLDGVDRADALGVEAPPAFQRSTLEDTVREIQRAQDELNTRFGALLGNPTTRWRPVGDGLPAVDAGEVLGGDLEEKLLSSLRLRLAATDLTAADARVQSAWLDFFPQPELFLVTPPIFTRNRGNERTFEFTDVTVTARLRQTIDLRGSLADRKKFAELDRELAIAEARLAVRTAAVEAMRLGVELERIDEDQAETRRRLELLERAVAVDGVATFQRRLADAARAREALARSELERVGLVTPLLTLDSVWEATFPYADARTPGRIDPGPESPADATSLAASDPT